MPLRYLERVTTTVRLSCHRSAVIPICFKDIVVELKSLNQLTSKEESQLMALVIVSATVGSPVILPENSLTSRSVAGKARSYRPLAVEIVGLRCANPTYAGYLHSLSAE